MLYLVPTPIGNLRDLTLRALDVIQSVHKVICEDTRHTRKLLKHYEIEQTLISFHEHSGPAKIQEILTYLKNGESLALVADAGTPLISDPGYKLVREIIREGFEVTALPGPTAVTTALVVSGLAPDAYSFFGFLPKKKGQRRKTLEKLEEREETLIFYESPFRILETVKIMHEVFGNREGAIVREISKKFEESYRGRLQDLIQRCEDTKVIGEIVLVIAGKDKKCAFKSEDEDEEDDD